VDENQDILVDGCVEVEDGGAVVIVVDEGVEITSLENIPLVVFDAKCGEVEVEVEYDGDVECDEAIRVKNEQVSQGFFQWCFARCF